MSLEMHVVYLPAIIRAQVVVAILYTQRAHEGGVEREARSRHEYVLTMVGQCLDGQLEGMRASAGEHHIIGGDKRSVPSCLVDKICDGLAYLRQSLL